MEQYIMLIVIVVVFGGMMWWQSKKAKQQQQEKQDFRRNLQPGTEVITIGQVIGKVVEVDEQYGGDRHRLRRLQAAFRLQCHRP